MAKFSSTVSLDLFAYKTTKEVSILNKSKKPFVLIKKYAFNDFVDTI